MIPDDAYASLPDDPDLAFIKLERDLRGALEKKLERTSSNDLSDDYRIEYMNHVLGVAHALGISSLASLALPKLNVYEGYKEFVTEIDRYTVQVKVRNSQRVKTYSVRLDTATKQKIRHHLNQIKEIVDHLDVVRRKKERLYDRIEALTNEVDRDRTRFDAAMALTLEVADTAGKAAQKMKPLVDSITRLIAADKGKEANLQLPGPEERKLLQAPKEESPARTTDRPGTVPKDDDDIPF